MDFRYPGLPVPGNDDFVFRASGFLLFETLDPVTLRVHSDDGFVCLIDGQIAGEFPGDRGPSATNFTYTPPRIGFLSVDVIMWERGGEAEVEFSQILSEATPDVWTNVPPAGVTVDNSQMAPGGVTEWQGWGFADPDFWVTVAGDQRRSEFTLASGVTAIADPDEWDDLDSPTDGGGTFNSFMSLPAISLDGTAASLVFDSSWRPEFDDNFHQSASVTVSYDGGDPVTLLLWLSDSSSPDFKDAATNETVTVALNNPAGASSAVITFGLFDAGNDWWWAIDNVEVTAGGSTVFSENFDNAVLGPNVDESFVSQDTVIVLVNDPNDLRSLRAFQGGCPEGPAGDPVELVQIMGGLGAAPDTFISPLGENVPFNTVDFDLTADVEFASPIPGFTLTSNGGGNHTLTSDGAVPVGTCLPLSFDVRDLATGVVSTISFTVCHLPLDVNQDGIVNIQDITAWGAEFNGARRPELADTNGDGIVDIRDATAVGDNWFGRSPATVPWNGTALQ